jgi:hypothetical protein
MMNKNFLSGLMIALIAVFLMNCSAEDNLFEGSGDVGNCKLKGSMSFDKSSGMYTLTGAGTNKWANTDEFFMAWRKETGDFSLSARIAFEGEGVNAHRKMGLIIRESLQGDAKYADVCVHGDGLTSLQYRERTGGITQEVVSEHKAPDYIKLERIGNRIIMKTAHSTYPEKITGEIELDFPGTVYIGIFVCSHEEDVLETVHFTNVQYKKL